MKKVLLMLMIITISSNVFAQTMKVAKANTTIDKNGNYTAINAVAISTGKNFVENDGTVIPVFKTSVGKLFIKKLSKKTGKEYRRYLTL